MPRPPIEVADVIRAAGESFFENSRKWLTWLHLKVLNAILRCRTAALGGHVDACSKCGHEAVSFNSCRNRHCPKCQSNARDRWLEARGKELLPTRYVHVVFTLPRQLSPLALQNKREVYALLFRASAATLLQVARDPKHLGAEIGFFSVLTRSEAVPVYLSGDKVCVPVRSWSMEPETPAPSARSLCGSRRRSGAGPLAMDRLAAEVLPAGRRSQRSVSGQIRGWPQKTACGAQTRLPRNTRRASESQGLRSVASSAVPLQMGGLLKTSFWRRATRASLSRPVHPSCGDFKPSPRGTCRWHGHVSLARFRSQKQKASDDAAG